MRKFLLLRLGVLLIVALLTSSQLTAQTEPNHETETSNNTALTAMPLTSNPVRIRGNLFPVNDVDYYSFYATAGSRVYTALMTSFSSLATDAQLTLISSDGTTVIEFDDNNGSFSATSSSIAGALIPATGLYYIMVSCTPVGTTTVRGYDLYLKVESGSPTPEVEPNNTSITANLLATDGYMSGKRDTALSTESDWFAFNLVAGETVFLSLDLDPERDSIFWNGRLGMGGFGDVMGQVLVVDDAGSVEGSNPNRPSEAFFITADTAGTYYVYIDASSAAVGGPTCTYRLSVSRFAPTGTYVSYASTNVPQTIGPSTGSVTSTITITDNKLIKNLGVRINLTHALMADVDAILTTPEGNNYHLFTDIGSLAIGNQTQMDLVFNDFSAIPPTFAALKGMSCTPEVASKLDMLKGMNIAGTWTLTLFDDAANASGGILNGWSLEVMEDTTANIIAPIAAIFSTDFEANDGGFTHAGAADEFEWGTPATIATATATPIAAFNTAHSGLNCWKTDLDNTYDFNSSQVLSSPMIVLPDSLVKAYLSWSMKYQMESASFDTLFVYIKEVGGSGLRKNLFTWLGATQIASAGNPTNYFPLSSGWGTYYADINEFAGKTIQFVVSLGSDASVNYGGVAIDDVKVNACSNSNSSTTVTACDSYLWNGTTYTSSGTYSKTIMNVSGCDSNMVLNLTLGNTTMTSNLQNICQGDSYVFNGHTYTLEGNYNDTLSSVLGCDSIIQLSLNVDSLDLGITLHNDSIIANQSAGSYQWIDCDNANAPIPGEINQAFVPGLIGNYAVVITNGTCHDTSACQFYTYVGIADNSISGIQVYPNPGSGLFNVILTETSHIKVMDIMGSVIYVGEFPAGQSALDLRKYSKGVYLLDISNEHTQKMLYLVIQD